MEKKFIMLELPNNVKEERNVLGIIKQPPAEVHNYRSVLFEIQTIANKINSIRNSITGGYRLTLQLFDEDKIKEIECNSILGGCGEIKTFNTIMDFAKWYTEEYSPTVIEKELQKKERLSDKRSGVSGR